MRSVPDLHSISGQTVKVKAVKVANFIRKVLCRPPLKLKIERLNENGQFLYSGRHSTGWIVPQVREQTLLGGRWFLREH